MVEGLSNMSSLGGWEIINEPEGSIAIAANSEPCFDTTVLDTFTRPGAHKTNKKKVDVSAFSLARRHKKESPSEFLLKGMFCSLSPSENSIDFHLQKYELFVVVFTVLCILLTNTHIRTNFQRTDNTHY